MGRVDEGGMLRMRAHVAEFPSHLVQGFRTGVDHLDPRISARSIVNVVGIGGSAIGAEILRGVVDEEAGFELRVVRDYRLPSSVQSGSLVVLASYSGNTWETLAAYDEAGRRKCDRIVVGAGGELGARAGRDGVVHVPIPSGFPPRAAVGYFLGAILGLVDPLFPQSNEDRVSSIADRLKEVEATYASPQGEPVQLAQAMAKSTPHVYAAAPLVAVARRWVSQIEENAKRLAQFGELPESLHNALVGWDSRTTGTKSEDHVVILDDGRAPPALTTGIEFFESDLEMRGVPHTTVQFDTTDLLETLFSAVLYGDHLSLALAARAHVDPYPNDVLERMKASVAKRASPGARGPAIRSVST